MAGDKLSSFDGDFAPYFQDLTTAALFCWINKHNISTNAYEDLVDIIMRPEFNRDHIVKNIQRFRAWRERLPLPAISAKPISISSKKTPSASKDSKMAYQLSISDIIWNVLNNPSLFKKMYFGPGVDSETKSEYWHGTLWAESPLFGQEQLMISDGNYILFLFHCIEYKSRWIKKPKAQEAPMETGNLLTYILHILETYKCGDFVYYYDYNDNERKLGRLRAILLNEEDHQYRLRIQKVLDYDDLPGTFRRGLRRNRSLSGEVWLQDEPFLTITTSQISKKISKGTL